MVHVQNPLYDSNGVRKCKLAQQKAPLKGFSCWCIWLQLIQVCFVPLLGKAAGRVKLPFRKSMWSGVRHPQARDSEVFGKSLKLHQDLCNRTALLTLQVSSDWGSEVFSLKCELGSFLTSDNWRGDILFSRSHKKIKEAWEGYPGVLALSLIRES